MGVLNKLQFWKKEEDFPSYDAPPDLPHETPHDDILRTPDPMREQLTPASDNFSQPNFSTPQYPQASPFPGTARAQPQAPQYEEPSIHPRDVELILAKLDAIKSEMDALHQRVRRMEQSMEGQASQKGKYW